jgi:hypothetical protein
MEEKDDDLIRKFINGGWTGDVHLSNIHHKAMTAVMQLQAQIDRYSTPLSHSLDDTLTDDGIDDVINKIMGSDIPYLLTKEKGYFIYWLMMHFAFLEDKGFDSQYKDITNNIPAWGRAIITERKYTEYDRAFLKEVTEWLPNSDWVYKKPVLNEHNDYHTILESLQSI